MKILIPMIALQVVLAGCAGFEPWKKPLPAQMAETAPQPADGDGPTATPPPLRPAPATAPGAQNAGTVTGAAPVGAGGGSGQITIAGLGDPGEPGLWMKTALVSVSTAARVGYGGQSVRLTLRPAPGSSQLSLAAMQALGAPLTDLVEVTVTPM